MIHSVGIDLHKGRHRVHCLDEKAQPCDAFSFQTTPEGLATLEQRIFRDGSNPIVRLLKKSKPSSWTPMRAAS
jgi:hypothetical protein